MELRMQEKYKKDVIPALKKELGIANVMEIPSIKKVSVNAGIGALTESKENQDLFEQEFTSILGQKPAPRKAKKSIAGFKIRQGDLVGYSVTLRGAKMWAFLDKFVNLVLPRVRDFNGLDPDSFDAHGNYSIGVAEHTIFPEINPNVTKGIRGLQITIVTNSGDIDKSRKLLSLMGLPFKKELSEMRAR